MGNEIQLVIHFDLRLFYINLLTLTKKYLSDKTTKSTQTLQRNQAISLSFPHCITLIITSLLY